MKKLFPYILALMISSCQQFGFADSFTQPTGWIASNGGSKTLGNFSTKTWLNCTVVANSDGSLCAGINTTTTGTIQSGQNTLTVASTTGWKVGFGIAIANAGTGGTTELISYITAINGSVFTLNNNAITTATSQTVNFDDTRALSDALQTGLNVHLSSGIYNTTSAIIVNKTFMLQGDGSSEQIGGTPPTGPNASIIMNRGATNNVIDMVTNGSTIGVVQIYNISVQQSSTVTPTAGFQLIIAGPSSHIHQFVLKDSSFWGGFGCWSIGNGATSGNLDSSVFFNNTCRYRGNSTSSKGLFYNNPSPNGDNVFTSNYVAPIGTSGYNYHITAADTTTFTDDKSNNADTGFVIDDSNGIVNDLRLNNFSCESATGVSTNNGCIQITASAINRVYDIQITGGESLVNQISKFAINIATNVRNVTVNGFVIHGNNSGTSGGIRVGTAAGNIALNAISCMTVPSCISLSSATIPSNVSITNTVCNTDVASCVTNAGSPIPSSLSLGCSSTSCNIGIGTVSPTYNLDVEGTVKLLNISGGSSGWGAYSSVGMGSFTAASDGSFTAQSQNCGAGQCITCTVAGVQIASVCGSAGVTLGEACTAMVDKGETWQASSNCNAGGTSDAVYFKPWGA